MSVRPLRQILFLQSTLVAILPFLIAAGLVVVWLLPQIDREIVARQTQLGHSIATQVETYLNAPLRHAGGLSLLMTEPSIDRDDLQRVLEAHLVGSESLLSIYLTDRAGRIMAVGLSEPASVRREDLLGRDLSRDMLFQRALAAPGPIWSDTFRSLVSGELSIAFASAGPRSMTIGEVDLGRVTEFPRHLSTDPDQLMLVIDRHGRVIADQHGADSGHELNVKDIPLVKNALEGDRHPNGEFTLQGRSMLGSLVHIRHLDWHVLVAYPAVKAYRTIWTSLSITLAGLFVALAFAISIAFYLSWRSARIFENLADHSRRVAANRDLTAWPKANIREFQELAANLQTMSDAIREQERQLFTLMSNLPGMAYRCQADTRRTLSFVSEGCLELLGFLKPELLGDARDGLNSLIHADDLPAARARIDQCLSEKIPYQVAYRLQGLSGLYKWGMDHGRGVWDEAGRLRSIEGLITDITAQRRAEDALKKALADAQEARDRVELILRSVADGLIFTDPLGRIVLLSAAAEELLGADLRDLRQKSLADMLDNHALREHLSLLRKGREETATVEFELPGKNAGPARSIQVNSAVVRNRGGGVDGIITLLRDVSRERELDRLKSEFISTAAHELRTPLTVIMGFSEILRSEPGLTGEPREYLAIILEKAEALQRLIDDLLDLGRVESGKLVHVQKERCDICAVIQRTVADFKLTCATHRFETTLQDCPVELFADPLRLAQMLENLLGNAVKFSPVGSSIAVDCRWFGTDVRLSVRDRGIGMTAEQAEKIFDKFYRVDASTSAKQGLGLGMTIVKSIVEGHDGRIQVISAPGQGTQVVVDLPIAETTEERCESGSGMSVSPHETTAGPHGPAVPVSSTSRPVT